MTGGALHVLVLALERVLGVGVVEAGLRLPRLLGVTELAVFFLLTAVTSQSLTY